jgi:hypothetical protein
VSAFESILEEFRHGLDDAVRSASVLGLDREVRPLVEDAARQEFGVAVLGRFKAGKSSVVNALLGHAVLPTDVLPCTSTAIEIRRGKAERWWEVVDGAPQERTRDQFLSATGSAAADASAKPNGWRVEVPVEWLPPGLVLIDTPGTNEDAGRSESAREELLRSDAAIMLTSATQAASIEDIDLAADLKARVAQVVAVVNRVDLVPDASRERLLAHARQRFGEAGIPAEHVLLYSALKATSDEPAYAAMQQALRATVSTVLLENRAGDRLRALHKKTTVVLGTLEARAEEIVTGMQARHDAASEECNNADARLGSAREDLKRISAVYDRAGDKCADALAERIEDGWDDVIDAAIAHEDEWSSSKSALFDAKAYAKSIQRQARRSFEEELGAFLEKETTRLFKKHLKKADAKAQAQAEGVKALVARAGIAEAGSLWSSVGAERLKTAMGNVHIRGAGGAAEDAALTAMVGGAVAAVGVGVLVAFPVALVGLALAAIFGGGGIESYVKGKVCEAMRDGLDDESVRSAVQKEVGKAVRDMFDTTSKGTVAALRRMVDLAERELQGRKKESRAALRELTDNRDAAQAALERLRELQGIIARGGAVC